MRQWMVESLRKFENRGIKIARVNSIRITKSIDLLTFCTVLDVRCDVDLFKPAATAQPIKSEVYDGTEPKIIIANCKRFNRFQLFFTLILWENIII